ncbi:PDC sensor domain-containing protein [Arenibacterium sp. LLYu02]|uniref:PDC sensor domain-containing protein n=1 Tax=Arenibacterium sp. LLYu02 TaxID=3404132 RepID=UPI003B22624C
MRLIATAAAILFALPLSANEFTPALEAYLNDEISGWANGPEIVAAIKAQNAANAGMDQAKIDELDKTWRAEVGNPSSPLISPVLTGPMADSLRAHVEASGGAMTEVFLMDEHGLNVAASDVTSDMWQGDEAKFQDTFGKGAGSVHISEVELDESTQRYQAQISMTIVDPETGAPIGAITVGVDAESLL